MNKNEIIIALEQADRLIPSIPGLNEYLPYNNLYANFTNDTNPMANRVCCATLTEHTADDIILDIIKRYESINRKFVWIVGPNSRPNDLEQRLEKFGFKVKFKTDGMYINHLPENLSDHPNISVKESSLENPELSIEVMAEGFEMDIESSKELHNLLRLSNHIIKSKFYLAYIENIENPVGMSIITYYQNKPVALMGSAATIPEYRGQGVYQEMLKTRISDSLENNIETIIVLADENSSAPICKKFGFKKLCEVKILSLF